MFELFMGSSAACSGVWSTYQSSPVIPIKASWVRLEPGSTEQVQDFASAGSPFTHVVQFTDCNKLLVFFLAQDHAPVLLLLLLIPFVDGNWMLLLS